MNERGYERDLKFDLFATQRGRGRQRRDLGKSARKLLGSFNQGRARQRPFSGLTPQTGSFFDQASLSAVTRQNLRLVLSNVGEPAFEIFGNAGMKCASRFAQERAIGSVLHQGMLEQIRCLWRHALAEQQSGRDEPANANPKSGSGLRPTAAKSA